MCIRDSITDEKQVQELVRELYENELTYFAELSTEGGLIQGRINITRNYLESYLSTAEASIAKVGDTYEQTIENLSASAVDAKYGQDILRAMRREKVLSDFASGKTDYHFDFLRRGRAVSYTHLDVYKRQTIWCRTCEKTDVLIYLFQKQTERNMQHGNMEYKGIEDVYKRQLLCTAAASDRLSGGGYVKAWRNASLLHLHFFQNRG